jgi:hypothetical protein
MSKGRFGGFRKGKKRYFDNWSILKSEDVAVPETVADLDYSKAKGIWNLKSTTQFPKSQAGGGGGGGGGGFVAFDEATYLGSPTNTYASGDTFSSPSGTADETFAFDMSALSSGDYGVILNLGGSARGLNLILESDDSKIYLATNAGSASGVFTSYYGQQGTLYLAIDYNATSYVYWWDGSSMNQILSLVINSDYAGGDTAEIGTAGTSQYNVGTTHDANAFTGTITEARRWSGTYFDFGTV